MTEFVEPVAHREFFMRSSRRGSRLLRHPDGSNHVFTYKVHVLGSYDDLSRKMLIFVDWGVNSTNTSGEYPVDDPHTVGKTLSTNQRWSHSGQSIWTICKDSDIRLQHYSLRDVRRKRR